MREDEEGERESEGRGKGRGRLSGRKLDGGRKLYIKDKGKRKVEERSKVKI